MSFPIITKYKGIIFDLDGTLTDSRWIWREADFEFLSMQGIKLSSIDKDDIYDRHPSFIDSRWGQYLIDAYCVKNMTSEQVANSIYQIVANRFQFVTYKPFASEFLQKLKSADKTLALVTGVPNYVLNILLYENTHTADMIDCFNKLIITSDMVYNKKPAPDSYLRALDMLGLGSEECLVFEDNLNGVQSSINAGIDTCVVHDMGSESVRDKLQKLTPYYISHFGELLDWVSYEKA